MRIFTRIFRLIRINFIMMRYNIDDVVLGMHWFSPVRFLVYLNPFYWTTGRRLPRGVRVRMAIEELGPIFVKAGQILSTRRDILPDDIAKELGKLQDRVKPFCGKRAKRMIEKSLGRRVSDIFAEFDQEALASASIAQVHAARLNGGESVVIKVLRPNIDKMIDRDVDLIMTMAKLASHYWSNVKHLKPVEIVEEIAQTLYDEIDLTREGSNASQLKRNFKDSDSLYIPTVYWDYSRRDILVIERIHGIPIHDIDRLKQSGINMQQLAKNMVEVFFTQIFRDCFFHADLHPGNIFVSEENKENPSFIAVDFGIVGSLSHNDQRYIAENMIAFFKRDYQRVAELHIESGWLPPDTRIDQFEGAIRAVSEPIFEQPLKDISFGKLLMRLFQVARRFNINVQPQLVLLQKTLLNIESLCRQLSPELDLWSSASPQIERWLKRQLGPRAFLKRLRENLPLYSEQLPEIPLMVFEVLKEAKHQQERARFAQAAKLKENGKSAPFTTKLGYFLFGVAATMATVAGLGYLYR